MRHDGRFEHPGMGRRDLRYLGIVAGWRYGSYRSETQGQSGRTSASCVREYLRAGRSPDAAWSTLERSLWLRERPLFSYPGAWETLVFPPRERWSGIHRGGLCRRRSPGCSGRKLRSERDQECFGSACSHDSRTGHRTRAMDTLPWAPVTWHFARRYGSCKPWKNWFRGSR